MDTTSLGRQSKREREREIADDSPSEVNDRPMMNEQGWGGGRERKWLRQTTKISSGDGDDAR